MVDRVRALIIVDMQNDFCVGGSVPVAGADALSHAINDYLARRPGYQHIVATKDNHINPGDHFSDKPDYVSSWPPHCVVGSFGTDFHPDLDTSPVEAVFFKGAYSAAHSGFEGIDEAETPLLDWLLLRDVDEVDVLGVATDFCVCRTAQDAARAGFDTRLLLDLSVGVGALSTMEALDEMRTAGVMVVLSS